MDSPRSAINTLPIEILLSIFETLNKPSLASVSRVCKRWNTIALPILYYTVDAGAYSQSTAEQQVLVQNVTSITFSNLELCALVRHIIYRTSSLVLPEAVIGPSTYPYLHSVTALSIDRSCDVDSYARLMGCCPFRWLKKIHLGLRCATAEAVLPKVFIDSIVRNGDVVLEEIRYSRLRTVSEVAGMGGGRDESVVVEDRFGGAPVALEYVNLRSHYQLFAENYIHYLSPITSLKTLDLDLGIGLDSFIDLRGTLSGVFSAITGFLGPLDAAKPPSTRVREKILRLSHMQFEELVLDVADEVIRQSAGRGDGDVCPRFLPAVPHYHPRRNQARAKLSTLPANRFRDLVVDLYSELLRSFPRLSGAGPQGYLFPPPEGFVSSYSEFRWDGVLVEKVRMMQVKRNLRRDRRLVGYLRDVMVYVVPLVYERLEEAGLRGVRVVRVRLVMDGPWIEIYVQRGEGRVEVVSLLPDVLLVEGEGGGRWGVYALYEDGGRVDVGIGLLGLEGGRWVLVGS